MRGEGGEWGVWVVEDGGEGGEAVGEDCGVGGEGGARARVNLVGCDVLGRLEGEGERMGTVGEKMWI